MLHAPTNLGMDSKKSHHQSQGFWTGSGVGSRMELGAIMTGSRMSSSESHVDRSQRWFRQDAVCLCRWMCPSTGRETRHLLQ